MAKYDKKYVCTHKTKFIDLLGDFKRGEIYLVAGDRNTGKTFLGVNLVSAISTHAKNKVAMITKAKDEYEMREKHMRFILGPQANNWDQYDTVGRMEDLFAKECKFNYEYTGMMEYTWENIKNEYKDDELEVLIIDWFYALIKGHDTHIYNMELFKDMKKFAKKKNIPIILLLTTNTCCDPDDYCIEMSDLEGLDFWVDNVLFIYKEDMNLSYEDENDEEHKVILELAKSSDGRTGNMEFMFNPRTGRFV